jgi:hypothetical protein
MNEKEFNLFVNRATEAIFEIIDLQEEYESVRDFARQVMSMPSLILASQFDKLLVYHYFVSKYTRLDYVRNMERDDMQGFISHCLDENNLWQVEKAFSYYSDFMTAYYYCNTEKSLMAKYYKGIDDGLFVEKLLEYTDKDYRETIKDFVETFVSPGDGCVIDYRYAEYATKFDVLTDFIDYIVLL